MAGPAQKALHIIRVIESCRTSEQQFLASKWAIKIKRTLPEIYKNEVWDAICSAPCYFTSVKKDSQK